METRGGPGTLGTFSGVFTPSVLTILGIILLRRLGFVVGEAGLGRALGILALATAISALTSVSLSAIATNRKVRGGGDYFLISRSLGVAFGGALGLVLFAAQSISVAFYCMGFGEAAAELVPGDRPATVRLLAGGLVLLLLVVAWLGADLATRFQYAIMAVLGAALLSFFGGGLAAWEPARLRAALASPAGGPGFWTLFAIFFPAVTGFTQGVSMSGDLRDPARSLPAGTFLAVGISTAVYLAAMVVLAAAVPAATLRDHYGAMRDVASSGALVDAGVLAATASSALASFLGAPRILQAIAADRVFTSLTPFAATRGPHHNPRRAVLLTGAIAAATIGVGNLNAIAAVVSMFFLISYGLLNYATYVEATGASPSFRPRFRFFHRYASLAGTLLCGGAMLAIDPPAAAVAIVIVAGVYQYLARTTIPVRWRDHRRAYRFRRVKDGIRELAAEPEALRDWQPHILVFTEGVERRRRILTFAAWIAGGSGMITAVQLLEGEGSSEASRAEREQEEVALRDDLADLDAFPLVVSAPDLRAAAATVVQAWGVGPIHANTVVLNWVEQVSAAADPGPPLRYGLLLRNAIRLGQNVVVLDADDAEWERLGTLDAERRRIDVWWEEDDSSRLALLFAYLMTRTDGWDEAAIRLLVPVAEGEAEMRRGNLVHRLEEMRIDADIETVDRPCAETVQALAGDAAIFLMPLHLQGMRIVDPFGAEVGPLLGALPIVAMVGAASEVRLAEPEAAAPNPPPDGEAPAPPARTP